MILKLVRLFSFNDDSKKILIKTPYIEEEKMKTPYLVTISNEPTKEEAIVEKEKKKQLELIEKIENEEKTIQHEQDSIPKENVGKLKPCLVTPYVITTEKEQTLEEAIRLTKVEYSNPLELIEKIENEEKTIQQKADSDS